MDTIEITKSIRCFVPDQGRFMNIITNSVNKSKNNVTVLYTEMQFNVLHFAYLAQITRQRNRVSEKTNEETTERG